MEDWWQYLDNWAAPKLALHLVTPAGGADGAATSALAVIRAGVNIMVYSATRCTCGNNFAAPFGTMLDGIATHYRRRSLNQADAALLGIIDGVIAIAVQDPATMTRELVLQLGGRQASRS